MRIEEVRAHLRRRLRQRPEFIAVSAKTGRGLDRLLDTVEELFSRYIMKISTVELNKALEELKNRRQPPAKAGRRLNMLYAAQTGQRPPRFRIFVNDPGLVTDYGIGRERARAVQSGRSARVDRLRSPLVRFLVAGAGSWGTSFTHVLRERGHDVVLGCHTAEQARAINETGRNPRSLPIVDLRGVEAVPLEDAPADVDIAVVAVPSKAFAGVVASLPGSAPVLSLTKGLDPATGERLSTTVHGRPVAVLSGPNMAEEIAVGLPTAAVIASEDGYLAGELQHAVNSSVFRAYVNPDVVGVELCAAAKNVIALAAGGVDGLELGDNSKASLITRGLAEMSRLGEAAGARPETFAGLAGMGDLIVTCWSKHGRNRRAGELIAQGLSPDEAVARIGQTVEGITTAPVLHDLSGRLGVELPITDGVCAVLSGQSLSELVSGLMGRQPTEE